MISLLSVINLITFRAAYEDVDLMEIKQIRLNNLLNQLAINRAQGKTDKEFAEVCGLEPSHLSQMKTSSPSSRNIGETVARRIERALGLPNMYMDKEHSGDEIREQVATIDTNDGRSSFIVSDESMMPDIKPNDEVWYALGERPEPGKLGVIKIGERLVVRRYREDWTKDGVAGFWCPVNNNYSQIPADEVELVGRATRLVRETE